MNYSYIITGCGKTQKCVLKISENSHFEVRHYAMLCQGSQKKTFDMGTELHTFQCVTALKVVLKVKAYTSFGAHKLATVVNVLVLVAQICVLLVLLHKVI